MWKNFFEPSHPELHRNTQTGLHSTSSELVSLLISHPIGLKRFVCWKCGRRNLLKIAIQDQIKEGGWYRENLLHKRLSLSRINSKVPVRGGRICVSLGKRGYKKLCLKPPLWRQLLQHSFFKGKVLKSLWKKYFYLPRRLTLRFLHSTLYHCYIHGTLKSTKRDSLTPPLKSILPSSACLGQKSCHDPGERCSAYSFLQKLKTQPLCSLWHPKATHRLSLEERERVELQETAKIDEVKNSWKKSFKGCNYPLLY